MKSTLLALLGTVIALGSLSPAQAGDIRTSPSILLGQKVTLACKNPGTHQDVAKTPIITNNTNAALPSGKTIFWNATDGDKGKFAGPLAVGASISGISSTPAHYSYSCTAFYFK